MNLNEECLLNYLINPQELESLTVLLEKNIEFLSEKDILPAASIVL